MPRPRSAPDLYLLSKISALYYAEHQTRQGLSVGHTLGRAAPPAAIRYSEEFVRRLAKRHCSPAVLLAAAGDAPTGAGRNALRRHHHVRAALGQLGRMGALYVGSGS